MAYSAGRRLQPGVVMDVDTGRGSLLAISVIASLCPVEIEMLSAPE